MRNTAPTLGVRAGAPLPRPRDGKRERGAGRPAGGEAAQHIPAHQSDGAQRNQRHQTLTEAINGRKLKSFVSKMRRMTMGEKTWTLTSRRRTRL